YSATADGVRSAGFAGAALRTLLAPLRPGRRAVVEAARRPEPQTLPRARLLARGDGEPSVPAGSFNVRAWIPHARGDGTRVRSDSSRPRAREIRQPAARYVAEAVGASPRARRGAGLAGAGRACRCR